MFRMFFWSIFIGRHRYCWIMMTNKWCAVWCEWVKTPNRVFFFALDMGNFYLASELPWGENCHSLTGQMPQQVHPKSADTQTSVKESLMEPELWPSTPTPQQWRVPTRPKEPAASSPAAAGFSSDKCTSEWQKSQEKERKRCALAARRWPAFCIIVMVWYTERKRTGGRSRHCFDWHDCGCFPNYYTSPVNHPSLCLTTDSSPAFQISHLTQIVLQHSKRKDT